MCNDIYYEKSFEDEQEIDKWVVDGAKCPNNHCLHNHEDICNLGITGKMRKIFDIHVVLSNRVFWCNKGKNI